MHIDGACHGGQTSFTATIDAERVMVCYCNDCQVLSGGLFRAVAIAVVDTLTINREPKHGPTPPCPGCMTWPKCCARRTRRRFCPNPHVLVRMTPDRVFR